MRKFIKIILSVFSILILTVITVPVFLSVLLSINSVQNFVISKAANIFSNYLGTTVTIEHIDLKLFNRVVLKGVYLEDFEGDTLIYAGHVDVGFRGYSPARNVLRFGDVTVANAVMNLRQDSTLTSNLSAVFSKFKNEEKKDRRDFYLRSGFVKVHGMRFSMKKYEFIERPYGVNFTDLDVSGIHLEIPKFNLENDIITAEIKSLSFEEKSGFECRELSIADISVSPQAIKLDDLRIRDEYSRITMTEFGFNYDDWSGFNEFLDDVSLNSVMDDCFVDFRTIAFFAPSFQTWDFTVVIPRGSVQGPVSDMKGYLRNTKINNNTLLDVDFSMSGLPEAAQTEFRFDVNRLVTEDTDIDRIYRGITGNDLGKVLEYIDGLGDINLTGSFNGLFSDFSAEGRLITDAGNVDLKMDLIPDNTGSRIKGNVILDNVSAGNIISFGKLGEVTMGAEVEGTISSANVDILARINIESLFFNDYTYNNIEADGIIRKDYYEGKISSYDRNAELTVSGIMDFTGELPDYDLELYIINADLGKLNLNKRDSVAVISMNMYMNAEGFNIDDINGYGEITDLQYLFNSDTVRSENVRLIAENNDHNKMLALYSDIMDVELHTKLNYADMIPYFENTLSKYISSFTRRIDLVEELEMRSRTETVSTIRDYYIVKANIKGNRNFVSAIVPELRVSEGTNLSFIFNPLSEDFSVMLESELVEYKTAYASGLSFTNMNQSDSIAVYLRTSELGFGNFYMPDFSLHGGAKNNEINISAGFKNELNKTSAIINTVSSTVYDTVTSKSTLTTRFYTSRLVMGENSWNIVSRSIFFGNGKIEIDRFRIQSEGQQLTVNGIISDNSSDTLKLAMKNFNLAPLSAFVDRFGFKVSGTIDGDADITGVTGDRLFYSQINFNNVVINDRALPDSKFNTVWDNDNDRIVVSLMTDQNVKIIDGHYVPKEKNYFVKADIPYTDLIFLSPFLDGVLRDIEGTAHTQIELTGTGNKPLLNGTIAIRDFSTTVDFTNVRYHLYDTMVNVINNNLELKGRLYDDSGGDAGLELALTTKYLADMNYDVRVYPDKLLALNTTANDNDIFYGRVYASGRVGVRGNKRNVFMDIYANTEANSRIVIPIDDAASISEADFIYFRTPRDTTDRTDISRRKELRSRMRTQQRRETKSDLEIDITMDINPGLEIKLQMDTDNKNEINAKGTGTIGMGIKPNENLFTMAGDFEIVEGTYDFSLPNLPASKQFSIERDSRIQWTGDPLSANLDIQAVYKLRASIAPLMNESYRQNVPVECVILLTDKLTQPTINFDVRVPTADTEIQSAVHNAMNTQEMKSTQFIWLLATNSFYVDNNSTSNIGTMATVSTGVEFLTNQLSSWFSNDRLRFNFGYRPKSDVSSDEIDFSYSQEIIPNKLLIEAEANYNLGNNQTNTVNNNANQLSGDFYITYIFDRIGNLRARAFTRTIDRFDENQGLQESGVGLYYKKDFDSFSDLFRRKRRNTVKKEEEE